MSALLWKPTLAATLSENDTVPFPVYASSKIDGVRAMVQGGVVVSRTGRPIPSVLAQKRFGNRTMEGLDGELTLGPSNGEQVFNRTTRVVMRKEMEDTRLDLRFNVFDWCRPGSAWTFKERLDSIRTAGWKPPIYIVKQTLIRNTDELRRFEEAQLSIGFEGIMLRKADVGVYMEKRSTVREFVLVKVKRMESSFARLVKVHPLWHNKNEEKTSTGKRRTAKAGIVADDWRVGSADMVDIKSGVTFSVTLSSDVLREYDAWDRAVGKKFRYTYQLVGTMNGVPRFPQCTFEELL